MERRESENSDTQQPGEEQLEFEDHKLRIWRLDPEYAPRDGDLTTLEINTEHEELFESRVYDVDSIALTALTVEAMAENPAVAPWEFVAALAGGLEESTFRILAKRNKGDGRVTFILVGTFAGGRTLLERQDGVAEVVFRAFVDGFEDVALRTDLVGPPTIVTLEEWRHYHEKAGGSSDTT